MAASITVRDFDKKLTKKLNKHRHTLLIKENITCKDQPTKILCVSNGGLDNGVTHAEILQVFSYHGSHVEVIMIPQKSYCFVCYQCVEDAKLTYEALNGYKLGPSESRKTDVILYISYVSEAPASVSPSTNLPPGLILLEDFISEEYSQELLESVHWSDDTHAASKKELKHRRVKHYGYEFKYSINNVEPDDPLPEGIPSIYQPLLEKLLSTDYVKHAPDQLTVNQYQPGQGIPAHVDTPSAFEDGLVSLSIGSQVLMEFRHPDGRHLSVLLPHRSALIMTGEARYVWSHGITPRKSDIVTSPDGGLTLSHRGIRTSFTFRKITGVRPGQEHDSKPDVPNTDSAAADLEKLHVHKVYEEIADNFSGTRHTPWPRIADFLKRQPSGSLLADIGCGNGKYLGINKHIYGVGSDRSGNLANIVNERGFQVYIGDVLAIPLRPECFDVCLCIAVIHHLSTLERRVRAVRELLKILRPGGQCLIYVWAIEQELNKVKSKYLKVTKDQQRSQQSDVDHEGQRSSYMSGRHGNEDNCLFNNENGVVDNQCSDVRKDDPDRKAEEDQRTLSSEVSVGTENGIIQECSCGVSECETSTARDRDSETSAPKKLEVHVNRTPFKQQDLLVPWQLKKGGDSRETFHRFYHVFQKGEVEQLCLSAGNCCVLESYYDQGNWAVILEKV